MGRIFSDYAMEGGLKHIIEISNLYHFFGEKKILEKVNLKIPRGAFVFLTGETGSGKTTFLKILHGELRPSTGIVQIDDFTLGPKKRSKLHLLRRKVQMIYQDIKLLDDYSIEENIELPMRSMGIGKKNRQKRLKVLLKALELESVKKWFPPSLSGGEKQRVAIARAISTSPNIILADEPTGHLDKNMAKKIMKILSHFNKYGTTIILATHSLELRKLVSNPIDLTICNSTILENH